MNATSTLAGTFLDSKVLLDGHIYDKIAKALQLPNKETDVPFKFEGLTESFNGYDIEQTADYIKLSAMSYICHLLKAHHWEHPSTYESKPTSKPRPPLSDHDLAAMYHNPPGRKEGTREHSMLAESQGFKYRSLLGEILYAYVICHPDIGYTFITLAKFSTAPNELHYQALKTWHCTTYSIPSTGSSSTGALLPMLISQPALSNQFLQTPNSLRSPLPSTPISLSPMSTLHMPTPKMVPVDPLQARRVCSLVVPSPTDRRHNQSWHKVILKPNLLLAVPAANWLNISVLSYWNSATNNKPQLSSMKTMTLPPRLSTMIALLITPATTSKLDTLAFNNGLPSAISSSVTF